MSGESSTYVEHPGSQQQNSGSGDSDTTYVVESSSPAAQKKGATS